MMGKKVMSSGHAKHVSGANGFLNEVTEARRVVKQVVKYLKELGETVYEFHDDTSKTQAQNLNTIVKYHNSKTRDTDFSIHFNAGGGTGSEVLHYDSKNKKEAAALSKVIANALGLKDRGAKERGTSLAFLRETTKPALLLEICFVDSKADAEAYNKNFDKLCRAIAEHIAGKKLKEEKEEKTDKKATKKEVIPTDDTLYRVVAGSFADKGNAADQVAALKKKGIDAFVEAKKK